MRNWYGSSCLCVLLFYSRGREIWAPRKVHILGEVFRMSNESFLCVLALQIKASVFAFYEMACVFKARINS